MFLSNDRVCHNIIPVIHNKQAIVSIFPQYDQPWKIRHFHYRTDIPIYYATSPSSSVRRLILNYDLHKQDYAPRFQASLALRTWISGILNHSVQHFYCGMFNTGSPPQVEGSFVLTQCEMGLLM